MRNDPLFIRIALGVAFVCFLFVAVVFVLGALAMIADGLGVG